LISLIKQSISAFISIFNALLYLKEDQIPIKYNDIIKAMNDHFGIDQEIFQGLLAIKKEEKKPGKEELKTIVWKYIIEVKKLSRSVDKMGLKTR